MLSQNTKNYVSSMLMMVLFLTCGSCSSKISHSSKINLKIELQDEKAWLNLMPGDNFTFHFMGIFKVTNTGKDTIRNLKLTNLNIYRDSILIYNLKPILINPRNSGDFNLSPQEEKHFTFQLSKNLKIKKEISGGLPISAEFVFGFEGGEKVFHSKIIKVEKVY